MPSYLIQHPRGQQHEDIHVEGDDLRLTFLGDWAVFTDTNGPCLALPSTRDATITRIDEQTQTEDEQDQDASATTTHEATP